MPPEFIHAHAIIGQNALQLALLNFYGHDVLLVFPGGHGLSPVVPRSWLNFHLPMSEGGRSP